MYLVSVYFDEKTNRKIQQYIEKVAEKTGNTYMKDMEVPPHMTITAFEALDEEAAVQALRRAAIQLERGKVLWTAVGQFFPYVLYLTPVLNRYLHEMAVTVSEEFAKVEGVQFHTHYLPFQWQPHMTIGKKLSKEEMKIAFEVMQNSFSVTEGECIQIGLAKPNPHRDILVLDLLVKRKS